VTLTFILFQQAIIVVPIAGPRGGAVVFGADKVRPLTGKDFGWLTALCNRLEDYIYIC